MSSSNSCYVVIGGGIAGISCAKTLRMQSQDKNAEVHLISASSVVKSVRNLSHVTQNLVQFEVGETKIGDFDAEYPGISMNCCTVTEIKEKDHVVITNDGSEIKYTKLIVCTGAKPKLIDETCPFVIGIRDTETVQDFEKLLTKAKKILIVGNGGIALELAYMLKNIEVVWAIKDDFIGTAFIDYGAANFLSSSVENAHPLAEEPLQPDPQRSKYTVFNLSNNTSSQATVSSGSALGPDWHEKVRLEGQGQGHLQVEYECEIKEVFLKSKSDDEDAAENWPVYATLTNGKTIGCDFIVSATGVIPNTGIFKNFPGSQLAEDGGVKVDENMRVVGLSDIYAAGDVCHCSWQKSPQWLQMRTWTQARQMGIFAAQCVVSHTETGEDIPLDFCFENFAHITKFFGYKVVLLGKFNAQGMDKSETELLLRVTPGKEYVKVVLKDGRMQGALLVGETDLEETFENLILNGMDLSQYGENLLHPNVDLEDYFD